MTRDVVLRNFFNAPLTRFFDETPGFLGFSGAYNRILNGKVDFEEQDDAYRVELEVPGVAKDEIKIDLKEDVLTVSWNRKREQEKSKKGYYERSEGSFSRKFYVKGADSEKVEAKLEHGILTIELKKQEEVKPKSIKVN